MERLIVTGLELTGATHSAYSNGRGIFMPDGNTSPDILSQPIARTERVHRAAPSKTGLMQKWLTFLGRENQTPDVTRLVKALVDSKLRPEHATLTFDPAVVKRAEKALNGKELTDMQKKALTAAHLVGEGKPGKEGRPATIGDYTPQQISEKARMLQLGGFTSDEARALMEAGVVGMQPPTPGGASPHDAEIDAVVKDPETNARTTIMPTTFTDPEFRSIAEKIQTSYDNDHLSQSSLQRFFDAVNKHAAEGANVDFNEARRLEAGIRRISELDEARMGRGERAQRQREPRQSAEQIRDNELKTRIAAAQAEVDADPTDDAKKQRLAYIKKERREFVKGIARNINVQSGRVDESMFEIIIDEENSLDYLVDRIISPPLDSETGDWSLGLYGQSNLDTIINFLRTQRETADSEEVRKFRNVQYNSVIEIEEAARLAHAVNKSIINADLKTFSAVAGSLDDVKLTRLSKIRGVGIVARLLEAEYGSLLARDGWVNSKNYATLFGKVKNPETGLLETDQDQSSLTSFRALVNHARARFEANPNDPALTDEMRELAKLEDWQVVWAFNIGKSLYNMWLRGAEWISQGQVPKGDKGYVSFPQESIARILNWPQWMLQRFQISESRGGMEWLERALAAHQGIREEEGYGHMGLSKIGGKKVENFEMPDMIGVRGWWATWREKQLLMSTMPMQYAPRGNIDGFTLLREGAEVHPGEITDLGLLLDTGAITFRDNRNGMVYKYNSEDKPEEAITTEQQIDYWKSIFLDQNGDVRGDFKMGLGASLFFLKPTDHDSKALWKVKETIRTKIWEKAAAENPLGLVPYLHGLEYRRGNSVSIVPGPGAPQAQKDAWRGFERKLFQLNEIKMQRIRGLDRALAGQDPNITSAQAINMIKNITLSGIITEETARADGIKLDGTERGWLDNIKNKGQTAAPHLANVRFEYNPFLNDTPLEKLDYSVIGHEGYRRMLNDTSSFQEANGALIALMDNPSKFKEPGEIFEAMVPFVKGVGDILGTEVGQKKGWLWLRTAVGMFERGSNAGSPLEKRLRQLPFINEALGVIHKPNSLAQKYAGIEASNWDSQQLYKAAEQGVHMGVISEEEFKKWKKRFGGPLAIAFQKMLRFIFGGFIIGAIETGKAGTKDVEGLK